jgi:hypothetical protein
MNLKRTLRYSIIKLVRYWKPRKAAFLADLVFILEPIQKIPNPIDIKNNPQANQKLELPPEPVQKNCGGQQADSEKHYSDLTPWGKFERWIRFGEFLAFVAAIVGACFIGRQLHLARDQLNAAQGQLEEMKRTRELDERAWISPYLTDNNMIFTTNGLRFRIDIKNSGKTPAILTSFWDGQSDNTNDIPSGIDPDGTSFSMFVSPNDESVRLFTTSVPIKGLNAIANKTPWYVFGSVIYRDAFAIDIGLNFVGQLAEGISMPAPFTTVVAILKMTKRNKFLYLQN